jgi:aspartokinase
LLAKNQKRKLAVVVSALSGVTDMLLTPHKKAAASRRKL